MKAKQNIVLIVGVAITIAVLLWLDTPSVLPRFANLSAVSTSLGQVFALSGVILFSINLMLSSRLPVFDKWFNGLNNVYVKHSQLGQIAFVLLLFHPLLLISKYASNAKQAASFLWISGNTPVNWGIFALFLMIIFLVLTLYLRPKYDTWKITHKFMGLVFFIASLHVILIPSDVSKSILLRVYILMFFVLGLSAYVYRTLLGKYLVKKYSYIVTKVKKVNSVITKIVMKPQGKKMQFKAGQFAFLEFTDSAIGFESHPFSMTSSPNDDQISFIIKNLGDYTANIDKLTPGTTALLEGPFGKFNYKNSEIKSQIWIAGGIGITPFISMAKVFSNKDNYNILLYYCVHSPEEAVYLDLLEKVAFSSKGSFRVRPYYSQKEGRITTDKIKKECPEFNQSAFLICSPQLMIADIRKNLIENGINRASIISEEFEL